MIELEELKSTWNRSQIRYSKAVLTDIFEVKTKRSIKSINRTMLWDYILMFITVAVLVGFTFILGLKSRYIITLEILTLTLIMVIHYAIKYHLLNNVNLQTDDLKSTLQRLIRRLSMYLMAYRITIPFFVMVIYLKMQWNLIQIKGLPWTMGIWEFIAVIPISITCYFLVKWISLRMYGRQLNRLKELHKQLTNGAGLK